MAKTTGRRGLKYWPIQVTVWAKMINTALLLMSNFGAPMNVTPALKIILSFADSWIQHPLIKVLQSNFTWCKGAYGAFPQRMATPPRWIRTSEWGGTSPDPSSSRNTLWGRLQLNSSCRGECLQCWGPECRFSWNSCKPWEKALHIRVHFDNLNSE